MASIRRNDLTEYLKEIALPWWRIPLFLVMWGIPMFVWGEYYLGNGLNQVLGVMLLPFAIKVLEPGTYSLRYVWAALILMLASIVFENHLLLFLAGGTCFLLLLEYYVGRVNYLPIALLLLMSPFLASWFTAFTFPLQLGQSEKIWKLLNMLGVETELAGNRFYLNGKWFAVQAECLGIHILNMGLFIALLVMALFEDKVSWSWWKISLVLVLATLLSYAANFIRMMVLVIFQSPPKTLGHEIVGLLSIGFCVALPIYLSIWFMSKWASKISSNKAIVPIRKKFAHPILPFLPHITALVFCLMVIWQYHRMRKPIRKELENLHYEGYTCQRIRQGIASLSSEEVLIYVKAPASFWQADHHPTICWRGSGYAVRHISEDSVGKNVVMKAQLHREGEVLYTAWWYANGEMITPSQWEWRRRSASGEPSFCLFNVSVDDPEQLEVECEKLLGTSFVELGFARE
ncbi:MAG: exosortase N [Bacteroidota bacterium]